MEELTKAQRRFLKSRANQLKPLVYVGKQGITDSLVQSVDEVLDAHELMKVKFLEYKDEKDELASTIAERTQSHHVTTIGHVALFYRQQQDQAKRKIELP